MGPRIGPQGKSTMRRRRSFQFVESGGPELVELLETQGYDWVREKHPEDAKDEDEMEQPAASTQLAFQSLDRGRNTRDGDRSQ